MISFGFEPGATKRLNWENRIFREFSPTLRANMGDNQVAAIVVGIDLYNQMLTGPVSKTLNSIRSDSDHVPCVMVMKDGNGSTNADREAILQMV